METDLIDELSFDGFRELTMGRIHNPDYLIHKEYMTSLEEAIKKRNASIIKCTVWHRDIDELPKNYVISKEELISDFIESLYETFGDEWYAFETCFSDGGHAYGIIYNNYHLRTTRKLTQLGLLWRRARSLKEESLEHRFRHQKETFYALFFQHPQVPSESFIKIGHTMNEMKDRRLREYFFSSEEKYNERVMNFTQSYLIKTDIILREIIEKKTKSLESEMIWKFKAFRKEKRFREVLDIKVLPHLLASKKECSEANQLTMQSFVEYTGYLDSKEYQAKECRGLNH
jgi:hypothetical protein